MFGERRVSFRRVAREPPLVERTYRSVLWKAHNRDACSRIVASEGYDTFESYKVAARPFPFIDTSSTKRESRAPESVRGQAMLEALEAPHRGVASCREARFFSLRLVSRLVSRDAREKRRNISQKRKREVAVLKRASRAASLEIPEH